MKALAVILVTYNSRSIIGHCLESIVNQTGDETEIIVVDNDSSDETCSWIRENYPKVRVLAQSQNFGYGFAANLGVRKSRAEVVMVSNPDVRFTEGSIRLLLDAVESSRDSFVTPKLTLPNGNINACGNTIHTSGIVSCQYFGEPPSRYRNTFAVPLLSGAVIVATRDVWIKTGGFDPEIFMYMEDAELSLRARLMGMALYCVADAVVIHDYDLNLSPTKFYWLERHRFWTIYKLFSVPALIRMIPSLILTASATWFFALVKGPRYLGARLGASIWIGSRLWRLRGLRRQLKPIKVRTDFDILRDCTTDLPLKQLISSPMSERLLPHVKRVYEFVRPVRASIAYGDAQEERML